MILKDLFPYLDALYAKQYTYKVIILEISSLLTKSFLNYDAFSSIYFLFNLKMQMKDTSRHGDDG